MDIQISQDIRKYKTKDVGNFSFKEAGFIALSLGAAYLTYKLTNGDMEKALLPMLLILVFGFVKPFGLTFYQFLRTVIKEDMFTPRTYYNETDFEYDPSEYEDLFGETIAIPSSWNEPAVTSGYKHSKEDLQQIIR